MRGQVDYLRQEIEDRKREHETDRTTWRDSTQQLHTLLAQQGQTIQALTQRIEQLPTTTREPPAADDPAPVPTTISSGGVPLRHHYGPPTIGAILSGLISGLIAGAAVIWRFMEGMDWQNVQYVTGLITVGIGLVVYSLWLWMRLWPTQFRKRQNLPVEQWLRAWRQRVVIGVVGVQLIVVGAILLAWPDVGPQVVVVFGAIGLVGLSRSLYILKHGPRSYRNATSHPTESEG